MFIICICLDTFFPESILNNKFVYKRIIIEVVNTFSVLLYNSLHFFIMTTDELSRLKTILIENNLIV